MPKSRPPYPPEYRQRMVDLAAELGDTKRTASKVRVLEAEADELKRLLAATRVSRTELRGAAEQALGELRPALLESTTQARLALRQLFGDERLLVYPDGRVEGSARLPVVLREVGAGDPACLRGGPPAGRSRLRNWCRLVP